MSTVHVGLVDQRIHDPEVGWDTNKIGGLPAWLGTDSSLPIPECKNCGQTMALISQIYCPLGGSEYHRCIYIFACPGDCSKQQNGWRAFRSMKHDATYQPEDVHAEKTSQAAGCLDEVWTHEQEDWGEETDVWGEGSHALQQYQESNRKTVESGLCSEALGVNLEHTHHVSDSADSNNCLRQNIASLSQLSLSGDGKSDSCLADVKDGIGPSSLNDPKKDDFHEEDKPAVEDILELPDAERWNAMAKLLNTKLEQSHAQTELDTKSAAVFESYYLSVVDEPSASTDTCDHVNELIRNYERLEGRQLHLMVSDRLTSSKGKDAASEVYEKTELKHGDRTFYKFMKRLQLCPQQCIRYERGGNPLLVSHLQESPVSHCPHCGARRIFEFQLMPPLISYLKITDGTPSNIEFGTVLVYTCERNCWPLDQDPACNLNLLEELIVLQGDPDTHLYR